MGELPQDSIDRVFRWAAGIFIWTEDIKTWKRPDHWPLESELEELAARGAGQITDDCDGHASLCRYALWKLKVPNRLLVGNVEPSAAPRQPFGNHCVLTPENTGLVLDCRHPFIVPRQDLEDLGYTFIEMSGLEPGDPWVLVELA